jgi:enamidase
VPSATDSAPATLIENCAAIATGDVDSPLAEGDAILVSDGRIAAVGNRSAIDLPDGARRLDAQGQVAIPGLIDSHIHPTIGDWTPRLAAIGWFGQYVQAGVTTALSQGTWAVGDYPSDRHGMMALGTTLVGAFRNFRPSRMKVHGAAVSLVDDLVEDDFAALADDGVWLIAEVGVRSIVDPPTVKEMLAAAHRHGFVSRVHYGPKALAGSYTVTGEMAKVMGAQITSHVNGGPTAPPHDDLIAAVDELDGYLELSYSGNHNALIEVAERARDRGEVRRLMAGSDTPTGVGITPRSILHTVGLVASFAEVPPAEAVAIATGNTAGAYKLATGRIAVGAEADILLIDAPEASSARDGLEALAIGDTPTISLVMIDGNVVTLDAANTLPAKRPARFLD